MINIINPDQKRQIRLARINVVLVRYAIMLVSLALLLSAIYGLGFWLVDTEKRAISEKISSQSQEAKAYDNIGKQAESFRDNLKVAKSLLGEGTSYSDFLTTLAGDLPSGTVITNLSLGSVTISQTGLTLDTRTASYPKVLELKRNLEESTLFENVSLTNASRPEKIDALTGLERRYPYEASFNVKLSTPKKTRGAL